MAYLLLHARETIPRVRLAPVLSPEVTDDEARANLRRQLHDVQGLLPIDGSPWLTATATSVAWNADAPYWLDVDDFERLSRDAESLRAACELYTSDLLQSYEDEWIDPIRRRLRERYIQTLMTIVRQCEDEGSLEEALLYAERLLNVDSWHEESARDVMRLRTRLGDRAGAIRFYHDFVRRLDQELGIEPSSETRACFDALIQGDNGLTQTSPVEAARAFLPPPLGVSSFVGRSDEMAAVIAAMDRSRIVTICGPGGVGKSRLASTVAQRVAVRYRNGAAFVELAALEPGADVAQHLARALNIVEDGSEAIDRLTMVLRPAAMLIVFDNCEHVIDSVAPLAYELLRRCKNLSIMATSRERLAIESEFVLRLEPLKPDEAMRLFIDRATSAEPSLDFTDEATEIAGRICRRLDNVPLAIELAAVRVSILTLSQIESRLSNALGFLTTGNRSAPNHHQTLRAAIEWSYRLLSEEERTLFASLSVFRNGATLEAVESVCSASSLQVDRIVEHLSRLASKSLIVVSSVSKSARYSFLESIRSFSEERLDESGRREALEGRHRDHFLQLVESASKGISRANELDAIAEIEADYDNIRSALSWSMRHGELRQAHTIALSLAEYWFINGMLSEARHFLGELVNVQDERVSPTDRSRARSALARFSRHQADLAEALALDETALVLARESGDPSALGHALAGLAGDEFARGRFDEALKRDQEACEAFRACANQARLGLALQNMGAIQTIRVQLDVAATLLEESIACHRACGDSRGLAYAIFRKGYLAEASGDASQAARSYGGTVELFRKLRDPFSLSYCLQSLSVVQAITGNRSSAAASLREALEISCAHGLRLHVIEAIERAVWLFIAEDEPTTGAEILGACEHLRTTIGSLREPLDADAHDRTLGLLRERLGPSAFDQLSQRGKQKAVEDLVVRTLSLLAGLIEPC